MFSRRLDKHNGLTSLGMAILLLTWSFEAFCCLKCSLTNDVYSDPMLSYNTVCIRSITDYIIHITCTLYTDRFDIPCKSSLIGCKWSARKFTINNKQHITFTFRITEFQWTGKVVQYMVNSFVIINSVKYSTNYWQTFCAMVHIRSHCCNGTCLHMYNIASLPHIR